MSKNNTALAKAPPAQPVVQPPSSGHALAQAVATNPLVPRIHLARMFPRDVEVFAKTLREEVLSSPAGMVYRKPQGKETLLGPSIRMAEVAARLFQNLLIGEPKIEELDNRVTVTVEVLDLESNVSTPGTATTSLVDSHKKRFAEHIISNLVNATVSKSKRNAIIAIIGRTYFDELVAPAMDAEVRRAETEQAAERQAGKAGDMWRKATDAWGKAGVTEGELLRVCGANNPAEVTAKALANLRAAWTAVTKEGVPARVALGLENDEVPPPSDLPPPSSDVEGFFGDDDGGAP